MVEIRTQWIRRFYNVVNELNIQNVFLLIFISKPVECLIRNLTNHIYEHKYVPIPILVIGKYIFVA